MFKAMKIKVSDAGHSELIQEELFRLGYGWHTGGKEIRYTEANYLYTEGDGSMGFGEGFAFFDVDESKEVTLEATVTYSFKDVEKPESVLLNGKEYLKSDLEEALNKLTPIGE